jgi:hypothetical protein
MMATSAWSAHIADDPDFRPPPFPEGFPPKILVYGYFERNWNWHPRQVDELTLEELEWLPVYDEAVSDAAEFVRKQDQFQSKRAANG